MRIKTLITEAVLAEWKASDSVRFDELCVQRGRLLRSGVPLAEVNRRLPLPTPLPNVVAQ